MLGKLFKKKDKRSTFDLVVDDLAERMRVLGPDDPLYPEYVKHMVEFQKVKGGEKPKAKLDSSTIITGLVYLIGIGAVLLFENNGNIISHKSSFGMASRFKP